MSTKDRKTLQARETTMTKKTRRHQLLRISKLFNKITPPSPLISRTSLLSNT
jgi:hypothetical protein